LHQRLEESEAKATKLRTTLMSRYEKAQVKFKEEKAVLEQKMLELEEVGDITFAHGFYTAPICGVTWGSNATRLARGCGVTRGWVVVTSLGASTPRGWLAVVASLGVPVFSHAHLSCVWCPVWGWPGMFATVRCLTY
jgi:hypothetical protein